MESAGKKCKRWICAFDRTHVAANSKVGFPYAMNAALLVSHKVPFRLCPGGAYRPGIGYLGVGIDRPARTDVRRQDHAVCSQRRVHRTT